MNPIFLVVILETRLYRSFITHVTPPGMVGPGFKHLYPEPGTLLRLLSCLFLDSFLCTLASYFLTGGGCFSLPRKHGHPQLNHEEVSASLCLALPREGLQPSLTHVHTPVMRGGDYYGWQPIKIMWLGLGRGDFLKGKEGGCCFQNKVC